ncbi:MAG TPA: CBS domain-containing protein [Solirubrobacteraceae bacterium]|nr:CBS domain-containing protein [Solirubrobacteraceae bacterium]
MSPRDITDPLLRETPLLDADDTVAAATRAVLDSDLPALPVVERGRLLGIFGEREFFGAVFPGYLKELKYAGFVKRSLEDALEKRADARDEPVRKYVNTEHVDVGADFSDAEVAEIFLHHRVLLVPVTEDRRVIGVITRSDFFRSVAERFLAS